MRKQVFSAIVILGCTWPSAPAAESNTLPLPEAAPASPVRILTKPSIVSMPNLADFYPAGSRRRKESGTAQVEACWDVKGRVTGATLKVTSGFEALDKAALKAARKFVFKPGTLDSVPEPGCYVARIRFSPT